MKSAFTVVVAGQSLITEDVRSVRDERFEEVVRFIRQADVAFTNFESTILGQHGGWPMKGKYFGYSRPHVLDALKAIGFNALALSNNHAFDLGPNGILSTLDEVQDRDFLHAGIGAGATSAATLGRKMIGQQKVALLAIDAGPGPDNMYAEDGAGDRPARPGVNRLRTMRRFGVPSSSFADLETLARELQSSDLERANYAQPQDPPKIATADELDLYGTVFRKATDWSRLVEVDDQNAQMHFDAIRDATKSGHFVIAYLHHHHWEPNWHRVPNWVQTFAKKCIDAGARMFVSHGAPVLQALEIHNNAPIFYGLGNFIFHTDSSESEWSPSEVWQSIVAACHYDVAGRLVDVELLPIAIGDQPGMACEGHSERTVPRVANRSLAFEILAKFAESSKTFGVEIVVSNGIGHAVLRSAQPHAVAEA